MSNISVKRTKARRRPRCNPLPACSRSAMATLMSTTCCAPTSPHAPVQSNKCASTSFMTSMISCGWLAAPEAKQWRKYCEKKSAAASGVVGTKPGFLLGGFAQPPSKKWSGLELCTKSTLCGCHPLVRQRFGVFGLSGWGGHVVPQKATKESLFT
jgi:hypothetical protein